MLEGSLLHFTTELHFSRGPNPKRLSKIKDKHFGTPAEVWPVIGFMQCHLLDFKSTSPASYLAECFISRFCQVRKFYRANSKNFLFIENGGRDVIEDKWCEE